MAILATNTSAPRELIPEGNHVARCYMMLHIGTSEQDYSGEKKMQNRVRIGWEVFASGEVGAEPQTISEKYTLSTNEKANLRKMLQSWRGKAFTEDEAKSFDVAKLLGVPCMLQIIHKVSQKGSKFDNIASVTAMPRGFEAPAPFNKQCKWEYDAPDMDLLNALPEFMKLEIMESDEYKALMGGGVQTPQQPVIETANGDDLPF